ncbi:LPS-assembly lipoprotein LptE [Spiribacter halobius]|uniref:LPS-assembly lipoprotein LptE n=1 Tax=Sediminicurvatus halobius TaxID=2182432 RepID=A0A2U2N851_9GAMM|nr:LPS assembly lipoprotein LptE [Spiribacter halobius]PWG64106.1 hypothetical protein DEM34_06280 [Spiribacter halobius]PWG65267.1 hypothetical protein DEM34_03065 [Spiribacter halobius]UEX78777.1 LPS assembly lipoprotein LptE [Spiribacter halobius]
MWWRTEPAAVARALILLGLSLALTACGWQLRGATGGGFEGTVLRLQGDVDTPVLRLAEAELLDLGAQVAAAGAAADAVLVVTGADTRRRTVSVDDRGRAREYELTYRLSFRLEPPDEAAERPRLAPQTVTTSAAYAVDPLDTQAADARETQLGRELRVDAVRLMLARVARAL